MKRKMFLSNPIHMVKDYELKKLLWQAGGGYSQSKEVSKI